MSDEIRCPRCHVPLAELTLGSVHVDGCGTCGGTLVEQTDLVRLLEILAAGFAQLADPDAEIERLDDESGEAHCPDCDRRMKKHGYQGSSHVMVDRCTDCQLIWLDGGELDVMAQLYLRSERHFQDNVDKLQELAEYLRPANYHGDIASWNRLTARAYSRDHRSRPRLRYLIVGLSTKVPD